jgi:hypothetical protein
MSSKLKTYTHTTAAAAVWGLNTKFQFSLASSTEVPICLSRVPLARRGVDEEEEKKKAIDPIRRITLGDEQTGKINYLGIERGYGCAGSRLPH